MSVKPILSTYYHVYDYLKFIKSEIIYLELFYNNSLIHYIKINFTIHSESMAFLHNDKIRNKQARCLT